MLMWETSYRMSGMYGNSMYYLHIFPIKYSKNEVILKIDGPKPDTFNFYLCFPFSNNLLMI
jgi:hypothetical protein